jgi:hypothetical protein
LYKTNIRHNQDDQLSETQKRKSVPVEPEGGSVKEECEKRNKMRDREGYIS